jgi:branched-chain amino acid transport system permease protein
LEGILVELFIAQLINGLSIGAIYALIVVGFNLLILIRGVLHFAYPHIVVICMYICWMILGQTNNNFALAIPPTIISAIVLVVVTEPIFRPLTNRKAFMETMILSLGIGIILTDIMLRWLHSGLPISFPATVVGAGTRIQLGLISFSLGHVYTVVGTIVIVIGLVYFLYRSKEGRAFRAIAQDIGVARLLGIPVNRTGIYSFCIAGLIAGITVLFLMITLGAASGVLGDKLAIKATIITSFAGMGNLRGGIIAALMIGLAEALTAAYLPGRWAEAIVFGAMMITIMIKPRGVFGSQV